MREEAKNIFVAIHGSGNNQPGYSVDWRLSGSVLELCYEDILDESVSGRIASMLARLAAKKYAKRFEGMVDYGVDFIQDIFLFLFSNKVRNAIGARLLKLLAPSRSTEPVVYTLVGHSLGAVIAYWFVTTYALKDVDVRLVTFGNPLGSKLLGWLFKLPFALTLGNQLPPLPIHCTNLCSELDPLSGRVPWATNIVIPKGRMVMHGDKAAYLSYMALK